MGLDYYKNGQWNSVYPFYRTMPVIDGASSVKTVPGATFLRGNSGNLGLVTTRVSYYKWLVEYPMTLTALEVVCIAAVAATNAVAVLYRADEQWQPFGAHLATSGSVDVSTTGVKTATLGTPVTLTPGRYVLLTARDPGTGSNPGFRSFDAGMPTYLVTSAGNAQAVFGQYRSDNTLRANLFSGPPVNPSKWTVAETFGSNADSHIWLGVFSV